MCRIQELKDETVRLDRNDEEALVGMLGPGLARPLERVAGEWHVPQ
jgi:hypothetical protein